MPNKYKSKCQCTTNTAACAVSGRTHQISLVPLRHLLDEFQVGGAHHGFLDGQVGQQVVVLHDVARVLAERAQVTLLTTHQDLALYITGSVGVGYIRNEM